MGIAWQRSLGTKLFALMAVGLVVTVFAVAAQNSSFIADILARRIEDAAVEEARSTAESLTAGIERWWATTYVATHSIVSARTPPERALEGFFAALPEAAALEIWQGDRLVASGSGSASRQDAAARTKRRDRWLALKSTHGKGELTVLPSAPSDSVVTLVLDFGHRETKAPVTAVLSLRRENVAYRLTQDDRRAVWLTSRQGRPLIAEPGMTGMSSPFLRKVKGLMTTGALYGASDVTIERFGRVQAAFALVPSGDLAVVVARPSGSARSAVMKILGQAALSAWVLLATAMFASFAAARVVTQPIKRLTERTRMIAAGQFGATTAISGRDEVAALATSVDSMSASLKVLFAQSIEAAKLEKEMETARIVQETLLPPRELPSARLGVHVFTTPASTCGGDWWCHFRDAQGREFVLIGDAVGHGASAALIAAMAFALVQSIAADAEQEVDPTVLTPASLLARIDRTFQRTTGKAFTMTMLVLCFDLPNRVMTFANAGQPMPYIIPASAADRRLQDGFGPRQAPGESQKGQPVFRLRTRGSPLGCAVGSTYVDQFADIVPGDKVLMFTDGLYEARDAAGTQWTDRRLRRTIEMNAESSAKHLERLILDGFRSHTGAEPLDDDVTLIILEVPEVEASGRSQSETAA